jgi:lipoprotein signal peptidase
VGCCDPYIVMYRAKERGRTSLAPLGANRTITVHPCLHLATTLFMGSLTFHLRVTPLVLLVLAAIANAFDRSFAHHRCGSFMSTKN